MERENARLRQRVQRLEGELDKARKVIEVQLVLDPSPLGFVIEDARRFGGKLGCSPGEERSAAQHLVGPRRR